MAHSESVDNRDDLPRTRESVDPIQPDAIVGAAHLPYLTPEPISEYIRARCLPGAPVG